MPSIRLLRSLAERMSQAHRHGDGILFALLTLPFFAVLGVTWIALTVRSWMNPSWNVGRTELRSGIALHGDLADMVYLYAAIFGVWEPGVTSAVRRFTQRDTVLLDIGAHIGYYTLVAKAAGGDGVRTVSVEPSPTNLAWLGANLAEFSGPTTFIVPKAIAGADGAQPLFGGPAFNRGYTSLSWRLGLRHVGNVESVTLHRLLSALPIGLSDIDVIKIDVEGGELEILADLAESAADLRSDAVIIAEITADWVDRAELQRILSRFEKLGFFCHCIRNTYNPLFYVRWEETDGHLVPTAWTSLLRGKHDVVISKRDVTGA